MLNVNDEKRAYDYSSSCTFYMVAVVVLLLCQAVAGFVSAAVGDPEFAKDGVFNTAFMIAVQLCSAAFIVLYTRFKKRRFNFQFVNEHTRDARVSPLQFVLPAVAALVLLCGMFLPTTWYGFFTQYVLRVPPEFGSIVLDTPASVVMIVIASVFMAPICEEIIYRGVLFNGLKSEMSSLKAVLLSALAFMLMHMSPAQVVFQLSLGVVAACIMNACKRLLPCIIMHAAANAFALVIELTPLGATLGSCVVWLTNNVAAAVFITLGLFVVAGALLFVIVKFGFGKKPAVDDGVAETPANGATDGRDEMLAAMRKKDGTFKYIIGAGICATLLIVNTVVSVL